MLASGVIVATSVPFWLKMLSTFMALSFCIAAEPCIAAELDVAFAGIGSIILSPSRERGCADLYVKRALPGGGPPTHISNCLPSALKLNGKRSRRAFTLSQCATSAGVMAITLTWNVLMVSLNGISY